MPWARSIALRGLNTGDAPAKLALDMRELTFLTEQYYDVTDLWSGKPAAPRPTRTRRSSSRTT